MRIAARSSAPPEDPEGVGGAVPVIFEKCSSTRFRRWSNDVSPVDIDRKTP